jgi:hypothetical protein
MPSGRRDSSEAEVLGALNHPNIAAIGLGDRPASPRW